MRSTNAPDRRGLSTEEPAATGAHRSIPWLALALFALLAGCRSSVGTDAGPSDGSLSDAAPTQPQGSLRIATWNIETFPRALDTVPAVARTIEAERLDVIAVQEITDTDAFFALAGELGTHDALIAGGPSQFLRVGMLVRRDRVEATRVQTLFLPDGYSFPRPVLAANLSVRPGSGVDSFDLQVLVVHLKANIDAESQDRRASAMLELDQWITRQLADPDAEHDIVIAGDFNDSLIDEPADNVFSPFLDQPDVYSLPTLPLETAGGRTFLPFFAFFDHFVMTVDALDEFGSGSVEVRHLEEEQSEYREAVSDHLPVIATFTPR